MSGQRNAVDDNVTIDPEFLPSQGGRDPQERRSRWWIGAAVVTALVLGWLLRSPPPGTLDHPHVIVPGDTTTPDTFAASVASSVPVHRAISDVPLRELVPGFADTITALTWGHDGVDVLRWQASQPAPETVMSFAHDDGGWNRNVDASGRWLAEIRGESSLTVRAVPDALVASPPLLEEAAGARAWSAVWHDTQPGRLAWLACAREAPDSAVMLYTAGVTARTPDARSWSLPDFACGEAGVWLARWGDWGFLLHTTEGSGTGHVLLNAEAIEVARGSLGPRGEWLVGVGSGGSTIWTEGLGRARATSFLLSADGTDRSTVPGLADGERLESALSSPDGSLLALVPDLVANFGSEVRIVEVASGIVVAEIAEPSWWVTRMVWSTESRFLVYERWPDVTSNWAGVPQDAELVFYDTQTRAGVALPLPGYAPVLRSAA